MSSAVTGTLTMHRSRDAMSWGLGHIEQQVKSIERAVFEEPSLAFDLAKTLVESTCRTILRERSISYAEDDDLPRLLTAVSSNLPFLPSVASRDGGARRSLQKTLNGLKTTVQGICELRNQCGFASHGRDSAPPVMEAVQALLAAEAADAIVGFLYGVHRQGIATPKPVRFDDNSRFNQYLDEEHGPFLIGDIELRPSESLFCLEPETYRIHLTEFDSMAGGSSAIEADEGLPC